MSLKTIPEIVLFTNIAGQRLDKQPDSKLAYALRKVMKHAESAAKQYNEDLEELRIEHCLTGEHGAILRDEKGGYMFDKAGLRALNQEAKKLHKTKGYDVAPHFVTIPETFSEEELEAFNGFVLAPK